MNLDEIRRRAKIAKDLIHGIKALETVECGKSLDVKLQKEKDGYSCFISSGDSPTPHFMGKGPTPGDALNSLIKSIESAVSYLA